MTGFVGGFSKVSTNCSVKFCVRHIWANFKLSFSGKAYKNAFWSSTKGSTKDEFTKHIEGIKFLNNTLMQSLKNIGQGMH